MTSRRLVISLYVVLFAAFSVVAGALLFDGYQEYQQLKKAEAANLRRLAEAQAKLDSQKKILERLRTDPAYVEEMMRRRTYARPGDMIFRFPE